MDSQKILETLSPMERNVLPFLKDGAELKEIVKLAKRKDVEVMRALQWLENKGILNIKSLSKDIINLGENGKIYEKKGLPD